MAGCHYVGSPGRNGSYNREVGHMFNLTEERQAIRDGVAAVCKRFGDNYWSACEDEARFPREFHQAMAVGLASPCPKNTVAPDLA